MWRIRQIFSCVSQQMCIRDRLNTWLTHYLYGVDNHVESLPAVLAQNNYDPVSYTHLDVYKRQGMDRTKLPKSQSRQGLGWFLVQKLHL